LICVQQNCFETASIKVLTMLVLRPGDIVTRNELHQKLWPNGTIVEFDNGINAVIKRLREGLGDSAETPQFIETLPRRGYRFLVPVLHAKALEATQPTCLEPRSDGLVGRTISHYRILERLGQGAMGVVYQAEDVKLGRRVALKFLPEEFSGDARVLERFEREAWAASALNHPNICVVYEVGEHQGIPFLAMEYVAGKPLDQLLAPAGLAVNEVLSYGIQIADALYKAHSIGIIHRDLKPSNIMVGQDGLIKLLDFGLAKVRGTQPGLDLTAAPPENALTVDGTILGTVQYMAPEQLEGREADPRTDIFALGAVLYEMATGRKAFEGKSQASLIAAILEREPPPISSSRALVPPGLDRVVATCLAKKPDDRWQSARDLLRELQWFRDGRAPQADHGEASTLATSTLGAHGGDGAGSCGPGDRPFSSSADGNSRCALSGAPAVERENLGGRSCGFSRWPPVSFLDFLPGGQAWTVDLLDGVCQYATLARNGRSFRTFLVGRQSVCSVLRG
jgi:serine/threonine protein kinase